MYQKYPFRLCFYNKHIFCFGLEFRLKKPVFRWDYGLNPINWATDFEKEAEKEEMFFYDHDDYEEEEESYYCYDHFDYGDDDDDIVNPFDSIEFNGLTISETVRRKNGYTALASKYVLIADIDCGDNIEPYLSLLDEFVEKHGGRFKVYKTKNGMRYIQRDVIYQGVNRSAIATLKALGSDPKYIDFCKQDGRFMARVTPKLSEFEMNQYYKEILEYSPTSYSICKFIKHKRKSGTREVSKEATAFIEKHDWLCSVDRMMPLA